MERLFAANNPTPVPSPLVDTGFIQTRWQPHRERLDRILAESKHEAANPDALKYCAYATQDLNCLLT